MPLAQDRGIAVIINLPFGRNRLFAKAKGRELPDFAREIDGTIRRVSFGAGGGGFQPARISITQRLAMEPSVTYTEVTRPKGSFVTRLASWARPAERSSICWLLM